jgi:hypothetical protein
VGKNFVNGFVTKLQDIDGGDELGSNIENTFGLYKIKG